MTKKAKKPTYSVAMSTETGCIVMTRSNGQKISVVGALTREETVAFCESVFDWGAQSAMASEPDPPRLPYNH
jgi:hypothetical protein